MTNNQLGIVYRFQGAVVQENSGELVPNVLKSIRQSSRIGKTGLVNYAFEWPRNIMKGLSDTGVRESISRWDLGYNGGTKELYRNMSERLKLALSDIVVVEACPEGVQVARDLGCYVIGIASPEQSAELYAAGAHDVAPGYPQVNFRIAELRQQQPLKIAV